MEKRRPRCTNDAIPAPLDAAQKSKLVIIAMLLFFSLSAFLEVYTKIVLTAVQSPTPKSIADHNPPGKFPSFNLVTNAGKSKKKAQKEEQHECVSVFGLVPVPKMYLKMIKYACTSAGAIAANAPEIDTCVNIDIRRR